MTPAIAIAAEPASPPDYCIFRSRFLSVCIPNSGARREPIGLAIVGRAAARGVDSVDGGCAAAVTPPRDRDEFRSHLRRSRRLQFRRRYLLLGAQLSWPLTPDLALYPTFDYYFVSAGSLWALNFDLK